MDFEQNALDLAQSSLSKHRAERFFKRLGLQFPLPPIQHPVVQSSHASKHISFYLLDRVSQFLVALGCLCYGVAGIFPGSHSCGARYP